VSKRPTLNSADRATLLERLTTARDALMDAFIIADDHNLWLRDYIGQAKELTGNIRADVLVGRE
jgi:hypothetical protein